MVVEILTEFTCPECGETSTSERRLYKHRYYNHGFRYNSPLSEELMEEMNRVSNLNLLHYVGRDLSSATSGMLKKLSNMGFTKKVYDGKRSPDIIFTEKALKLFAVIESEA